MRVCVRAFDAALIYLFVSLLVHISSVVLNFRFRATGSV